MTEFVLFMVFSVIEIYAMLYLAFSIFKIDQYPSEMLFVGFILGFFSYVIRNDYGWVTVDVVIQYILVFLFFWLLFRIHIFYAAIMTGIAYQTYTFLQSIYYYIFIKIGFTSFQPAFFPGVAVYILQSITAVTAIIAGMIITNKRKGFDFIPDKQSAKITISRTDWILFTLNAPSVLVLIFTVYISNVFTKYYMAIPFAYALILYVFIFFSYGKDRRGNGNISF